MKKAFKLFGFIALSMTLAVACGNANNTPAEEEVVAEETVEATEQVVEEVAAPATQATCDEKKDEVCDEKKAKLEDAKAKFENGVEKAGEKLATEAKENVVKQQAEDKAKLEDAKAKFGAKAKGNAEKGEIKVAN